MKTRYAGKKIGIIGFGCVGQGLYDVVQASKALRLEVARICVKDEFKKRSLPATAFTYDPEELLNDSSIHVLVELINNADEAFAIVKQALMAGKTVVSANKKMVAEHLPELLSLREEYGGSLLYEGAVCGSIPILRTLESYYGTEPLQQVSGILNGSSNYILHKLATEGLGYEEALKQAQKLGFAEADPNLDVEGGDALNKLCIITAHAFGVIARPHEVLRFGIQHIAKEDVALAQAVGASIKLVATAKVAGGKLQLHVLPAFVSQQHELFAVNAEYNGVEVEPAFAGIQFLKGKGAGAHPTGSAVWADVAAAFTGFRYSYPKLQQKPALEIDTDVVLLVYVRGNSLVVDNLVWLAVEYTHETPTCKIIIGYIKWNNLLEAQHTLDDNSVFVSGIPSKSLILDFIKIIEGGKSVLIERVNV